MKKQIDLRFQDRFRRWVLAKRFYKRFQRGKWFVGGKDYEKVLGELHEASLGTLSALCSTVKYLILEGGFHFDRFFPNPLLDIFSFSFEGLKVRFFVFDQLVSDLDSIDEGSPREEALFNISIVDEEPNLWNRNVKIVISDSCNRCFVSAYADLDFFHKDVISPEEMFLNEASVPFEAVLHLFDLSLTLCKVKR